MPSGICDSDEEVKQEGVAEVVVAGTSGAQPAVEEVVNEPREEEYDMYRADAHTMLSTPLKMLELSYIGLSPVSAIHRVVWGRQNRVFAPCTLHAGTMSGERYADKKYWVV